MAALVDTAGVGYPASDPVVLPPEAEFGDGGGAQRPIHAQVSAAFWPGAIVGVPTAAGVYPLAQGDANETVVQPRLVCLTRGKADEEGDLAKKALIGPFKDSAGALIGVPDSLLYLTSAGVAGTITETVSVTSTDSNVVLGHVIKPGWVLIDIGWPHVADTTVT
jgi:hypothetical protein